MAGIEAVELRAGPWTLRPPAAEDAAEALAMLRDPETARWNPAPAVVDLEQAREWCIRGADWAEGDHATFSVVEAATGRLAGNVSLWRLDLTEHRSGEIGYRTAPWARGRGVATIAVGTSTAWAFASLGIERVQLQHAVPNEASCRIAARCGYLLEGVLRGGYRTEDGTRIDEHLHARLSTD
jgi:RimJ/RimL family protein N-acetyltransferase